jgi:RNA polymerase sigma-70 factor, ECF subfamily
MSDPARDRERVRRALAGDAAAIEELARAWLRPVYAIGLAYLRRPTDAEDLAQDVVVHALSRLEECRDPSRASAWVATIARNRARNALDARRLRDPRPEGAERAGEAEAPGLRRDLLRALETLTELQREVLLLHDLEGWSHAEIADALETTEESSRQHLLVARRKVRGALTEEAR